MKSIFFDSGLQHSFDENGYVIVPFLDPQQIVELDSAYHSLSGESGLNKGWHATIHSDNPEYKRKISDAICAEFEHPAKKYVKDYKAVFANFTVKEPNREDSQFNLHLDWSMTDETRFSSLTIWTPLIDITDNNGYLWVLKGSHKLGFTIRGGPGLHTWSGNKSREFNPPQFERVILKLQERNFKPVHTVVRYNYTMEESREYMLNVCKSEKNVSFEKVFEICEDRIHAIFLFLSLLELVQLRYMSLLTGEGRNNFIVEWNENREQEVVGLLPGEEAVTLN